MFKDNFKINVKYIIEIIELIAIYKRKLNLILYHSDE
jgi:hypothetical protein